MDKLCQLVTPVLPGGSSIRYEMGQSLGQPLLPFPFPKADKASVLNGRRGTHLPSFESPRMQPVQNTLSLSEGWRNIYTFPLAHSREGKSLKTAARFVKGHIFQSTSNSGKLSNLFANYLKIHPLLKRVSAVIVPEIRCFLSSHSPPSTSTKKRHHSQQHPHHAKHTDLICIFPALQAKSFLESSRAEGLQEETKG